MAEVTKRAKNLESMLVGKTFEKKHFEAAALLIREDFDLKFDAIGGMPEYRMTLAGSFLLQFFQEITTIALSAVQFKHPKTKGNYPQVQSMQHLSALKQTTGEAIYVDDIPLFENELYAAVIYSSQPHARILKIDYSDAIQDGIHFIDHTDVPGENLIGAVMHDEELFATETVHCHGQLIALCVGPTFAAAQKAAKKVKIEYERLPYILTIEEAIENKSFFPSTKNSMSKWDPNATADFYVEGEVNIGAQEHFYLETFACQVVPNEEDFFVTSSSQNPTQIQMLVAKVLGVGSHRVRSVVKRLGGGFGGKETKPAFLSCALAVAANKLRRPVRCQLDRNDDMIMSGTRNPFKGIYKVGFNADGKIISLDLTLYANGGYSADLSLAVMERAVSHCENAYFIPNIRCVGQICRTNIPSNTAFRGFGAPQAMFICESWITKVAQHLGKTPEEIREINLFQSGQSTHYNQILPYSPLPKMFHEIKQKCDYNERLKNIVRFNAESASIKRGISIVPTKFGISFSAKFCNQAGALVQVYRDGTVLISHGGVEMGQGLHTKMVQVVSRALKIPTDCINIVETNTSCVPNTSPTAASASSDLNGMALVDACNKINQRLKPFRDSNPDSDFKEIVSLAYFNRVSLSATGFYATPGLEYDWETNQGDFFKYYTFGVACSEVEVNTLTGDHKNLRTDILMDLGSPINFNIDVGQVYGAFTQGLGLFTIEQHLMTPSGHVFTTGPGVYKIPAVGDIPLEFNVDLYDSSYEPKSAKELVLTSKAVGEPPLFLAASVYFAIQSVVDIKDSPATCERIRLAVKDKLTETYQVEPIGKPFILQI